MLDIDKDFAWIEKVLRRARNLGLSMQRGGLLTLYGDATVALDALDRVKEAIERLEEEPIDA